LAADAHHSFPHDHSPQRTRQLSVDGKKSRTPTSGVARYRDTNRPARNGCSDRAGRKWLASGRPDHRWLPGGPDDDRVCGMMSANSAASPRRRTS